MSHHLLRNQNGHLLRVDHRVYEQGYVLDLPTHLLRGTEKQKTLMSDKAWSLGASVGYSPYVSSDHTDHLPTYTEVVSSLELKYSTGTPGSNWINGGGSFGSGTCASADIWHSEVEGRQLYRYEFVVRACCFNFSWPSGYSTVPAICFTANTSFQNRGVSSIVFRAFACDSVYAGGTQFQPRYTYNPMPTSLAALNALPGGFVSQSDITSREIVIQGPFTKKKYITVVAYPQDFSVPYQDPSPHSSGEAYFCGHATAEVLRSGSFSGFTAWVID